MSADQTTPTFHVEEVVDSGRVTLKLIGQADSYSAPILDRALLRVSSLRPQRVVFDLAGLLMISSLALGALVAFNRGLSRHGGRAALVGATGIVEQAIVRTRINELFDAAG